MGGVAEIAIPYPNFTRDVSQTLTPIKERRY